MNDFLLTPGFPLSIEGTANFLTAGFRAALGFDAALGFRATGFRARGFFFGGGFGGILYYGLR